jgi:hypothetical protein
LYILPDTGEKWEYNGSLHQLFTDFRKAYDSVKGEVLYDLLLEFGTPKKLVRQIKVCFETRRCSVAIALQFCLSICHQESPTKSGLFGNEWDTSAWSKIFCLPIS